LVEMYDYDTIWNQRWTTPKVELGTFSDNMYCNQKLALDANMFFYIKKVYNRSSRYPDSIVNGLTKIGGLLAIFRIGLLLSYLHQSKFEKKLMARLENQNEKVDMMEVKKLMSIENYLSVVKEQRQEIKELKS
jgi:hypothetical protein